MELSAIMSSFDGDGGAYRDWWDAHYTSMVRLPGFSESSECLHRGPDRYTDLESGGWCHAVQFMVEFGGWLEDDSWADKPKKVKHRTKAWIMK